MNALAELLSGIETSPWYLDMPPKRGYVLNLALEEMISNIIKYGYDDGEAHRISVAIEPQCDGVGVVICDDGHKFDPLCATAADVECDVENRRIGGVGILLTKRLSRSVEYRRDGEKNVVTILI